MTFPPDPLDIRPARHRRRLNPRLRGLLDEQLERHGLPRQDEESPQPVELGAAQLRELSPREVEVLALIAEGLTNKEIGRRLYLTTETIKSHVRHLLAALGARNRYHAVALGFRGGSLT